MSGSAYWRLGIPSRYVWHEFDPERESKIAAERAETSMKSAAGKGQEWSGKCTCGGCRLARASHMRVRHK